MQPHGSYSTKVPELAAPANLPLSPYLISMGCQFWWWGATVAFLPSLPHWGTRYASSAR